MGRIHKYVKEQKKKGKDVLSQGVSKKAPRGVPFHKK